MDSKYILLLIFFIFIMKRRKKYSFDPQNPLYIQSQFDKLKSGYSKETLKDVERIYRVETAHFKSGQYLDSLSAGQVYSIDGYKLNWDLSEYQTVQPSRSFMVGSKEFVYVAYPSLFEALRFLADYIERHSAERWFSTDEKKQAEYRALLNSVKTRFV